MILRYERLQRVPAVFKSMTGLQKAHFDELVSDVLPRFHAAEYARLDHPDRKRAVGGGPHFDLDPRNQLLLTVIWLRLSPSHEVLAYLFGVSDSTVSRTISRMLPLLEASGKDTMRMPDPGRKRRRSLDAAPRKKPRGQECLAEDIEYNRAFWKRRIVVEHSIGRMRRYQSISQRDRNHRQQHTPARARGDGLGQSPTGVGCRITTDRRVGALRPSSLSRMLTNSCRFAHLFWP